jgi:hypothetical protein
MSAAALDKSGGCAVVDQAFAGHQNDRRPVEILLHAVQDLSVNQSEEG